MGNRYFLLYLNVNDLIKCNYNSAMNKFEKACIKVRILQLAKLKSTGTPSELALKFEISVRSIKRIIRELRDEGSKLKYDYNCMSYVLT